MPAPLNLVLVISSLGCGGAERVVQLLSEGFSDRGHRVKVITTTEREDFFSLPEVVERVSLNIFGSVRKNPERRSAVIPALWHGAKMLPRLWQTIRATSPDFVITFGDEINVLTLIALFSMRRKIVVTEHVDPRWHQTGVALRMLRRVLYPRAYCLVSVSRGADRCFDWLAASQRTVIHNPVASGMRNVVLGASVEGVAGAYVVAMGRLIPQKGFDLLLDAFSDVSLAFPGWKLVILGDGPERSELMSQARSLGIADRVQFLGAVRDPAPYLLRAGFLVMSSRFEGFGNVLIEAMACGLPVVSFDCPSGPAEIVNDGRNGMLVAPQDTAALAHAMKRMIADEPMRRNMARHARVDARRFELDSIVDVWERHVFYRGGG